MKHFQMKRPGLWALIAAALLLVLVLLLAAPAFGEAEAGRDSYAYTVSPRSATTPQLSGNEYTFTLRRGQCSRQRDAGGGSDCAHRRGRSVITTGTVWREARDWQLGQTFLIGFEFWIDPKLRQSRARPKLSIARWYAGRHSDKPLFELALDPRRGVTFMGRRCIGADQFGGWHRFYLRVRWAADQSGFVEARCNSSLHRGTPIFARSNIVTNLPLSCATGAGTCNRRGYGTPDRFNLQLGVIADPSGGGFAPLPPGGVTVKMRRLVLRRLFVVIGRVENH